MSWFLGWVSYLVFEYFYFGTFVAFLAYYNQENKDISEAPMVFALWPVEVYHFAYNFPTNLALFSKRMRERRIEQSKVAEDETGGAAEVADTPSV